MVVIVNVLFDFVIHVLYISHVLVELALLLLAGGGLLALGLFHFDLEALVLFFIELVEVPLGI